MSLLIFFLFYFHDGNCPGNNSMYTVLVLQALLLLYIVSAISFSNTKSLILAF